MSEEVLTVESVSERLAEFVSPNYKWPAMPSGWQLEFVVYPDGEINMDFLHPVSCAFWSEDNEFLDLPIKHDGTPITVDILKKAAVPFMTTFGHAEVSNKPIIPHLKIVLDKVEPTEKELNDFNEVVAELTKAGTLAGTIEYGQDDEWMGIVYEKDMSFSNPKEQNHFAHLRFNGAERV